METRHLRIFVAVYKSKSFTKAAELLFTSQPTISEHMRNLEESLSCKLFDRLGRSIMPTPEAELLYPKAVELLDEMKKIEETLASVANSVSGELIVGASTIPGAYVLPEYAAAFKNRYPGVSFEIRINDSAQVIKSITNHELYIGIVGARIPSSKLEYTPFGGDELILAAAVDKKMPAEIDPHTLKELDFLLREEGSGTGRNVESYLNRFDIHRAQMNVRAVLGSSTAIKEAVKADLGVAIISRAAVRDDLECGKIKEIKIKGLSMKRSFYIVTARKRTMPNHYLVFASALTKAATGHQGVFVDPGPA